MFGGILNAIGFERVELVSPPSSPTNKKEPPKPTPPRRAASARRLTRFGSVLGDANVSKQDLAELAWNGVPPGYSRCEIWQLLLDYRPLALEGREDVLQRKRQEYYELRRKFYDASGAVTGDLEKTSGEALLLKQIRKDLPRTQVRIDDAEELRIAAQAVKSPQVQSLMERVLFIWAVQKNYTAYVQGIDGILLMLLMVFLVTEDGGQLNLALLETLGEARLRDVEADSYWCVSKILSLMYDHHDEGFPGIQRMTNRLMELIWRIDEKLARHLDEEGFNSLEAGVRWIGCLMVRELPVAGCSRLWDTLLAEYAQAPDGQESDGFETMLLYFCVCFLARHSLKLLSMDLEGITIFMKQAPADAVSADIIEMLLGEAFVLKEIFQQAQSHLKK